MPYSVVLCRHTQTDHNVRRIFSGQLDVPLNSTGIGQANTLAPRVAGLGGICIVLGSNLQRAAYLAERIGKLAGVRVKLTPDLREASVGQLEGLTRAQFPQKCQGEKFHTSNPDFDFRSVGGERAADVIERQLRALRRAEPYLELSGAQTARVVVVGHRTALRTLFQHRLGVIRELHEQGDYQEIAWPL